MKIYIDTDYKCHVSNGDSMRELDVSFFDGKCPEFIEGYRHIPDGEVWVNPDGVKCSGTGPWKDYNALKTAQLEYELAQVKAELAESGGSEALLEAADVAYKEGVNSAYD